MTIRTKLIGTVVGITSTLFILCVTIYISVSAIKDKSKQASEESIPYMLTANSMKFEVCQVQQFLSDASATKDEGSLKGAEASRACFFSLLEKSWCCRLRVVESSVIVFWSRRTKKLLGL